MKSWIAAGTLALVLAVGLAVPAEAGHRHSRYCGHRYSHSYRYDRYQYPVYDYGYRSPYRYAPYGYYSPYRYGAPYLLYAPPPPAYGYYSAPYRKHYRPHYRKHYRPHYRPHLSVTLGLW